MDLLKKRRGRSLILIVVFFLTLGLAYYTSSTLRSKLISALLVISKLGEINLELPSEIYDRDGNKFAEFGAIKRYYKPLSEIAEIVQKTVLSSEDRDFYSHYGIDCKAIARAFLNNLAQGGYKQGASTITQQLARFAFLTQEKTLTRKIQELVFALFLEQKLSKEKILELYLNSIYFGSQAYGIEAASLRYFAKNNQELNISEVAFLIGLISAPSRLNPYKNFKMAKEAQKQVLIKLLKNNIIDKKTYYLALNNDINLKNTPTKNKDINEHFISFVRREMARHGELLGKSGLKVYTSLDSKIQKTAHEWLKTKKNTPEFNSAFLALDPKDSSILALHGSQSFKTSMFNRAVHTYRDLGELALPIIYGIAIENNYHPLSTLVSADDETAYLYRSLLQTNWEFSRILLRQLGFSDTRDKLDPFALKLGGKNSEPFFAITASIKDLLQAYSSFYTGKYQPMQAIWRIEEQNGKVLYKHKAFAKDPIISKQSGFVLRKMLENGSLLSYNNFPKDSIFIPASSDDGRNLFAFYGHKDLLFASYTGSEHGLSPLFINKEKAYTEVAKQMYELLTKIKPSFWLDNTDEVPPNGIAFSRIPIMQKKKPKRIDVLPFVKGQEPADTKQLLW